MGALHDGHFSLIKNSRRENDLTAVSIFINPKQFGPREDYRRYPRGEKKDKILLKKLDVDILFYPTVEEMYPQRFLTYVEVNALGTGLCGKLRPNHFRGVTTVVAKLINIVSPDRIYLGQKDAQQALIIRKMIQDLNMPVVTRICPTIRESDGLALSSRNQYLNASQRKEAGFLYRSLKEAKHKIKQGETSSQKIKSFICQEIQHNTSAAVEYIEIVNADNLESRAKIQDTTLIAIAVKFGKTRLIDNITVKI